MTDQAFKYEVAISFLAQDEALAIRLADAVRDRMAVFVYSEQQKELAGRDGVEAFTDVFRSQARICVVLYRAGWGTTKWTRVEETAIRNRGFDEGFDFLLVISLDESGGPAWMPKTRIWLGFERFGLDGAAAVVDARVQDAGGRPKPETARERAARLGRQAAAEEERSRFLRSKAGVDAARAEVEHLFAYLETESAAIAAADPALDLQLRRKPGDRHVCAVSSRRASFTLGWWNEYGNTLDSSSLLLREFDMFYSFGGISRDHEASDEERYHYSRRLAGAAAWHSERDPERLLSTTQLGDALLTRLLDRAHANRDRDDLEF